MGPQQLPSTELDLPRPLQLGPGGGFYLIIGTSPSRLQSTNFSININVYFFMALKHGMSRKRAEKIQLQTSINK